MKRWMVLGLLALLMRTGIVQAETDLGQFCFLFQESGDVLRVAATQADGEEVMIGLKLRQRASAYQLGGVGVVVSAYDPPEPEFYLELYAALTHATTFFGNNRSCLFHAFLRGGFAPLNGPITAECLGLGEEPFTASDTISLVPCASLDSEEFNASRAHLPSMGAK